MGTAINKAYEILVVDDIPDNLTIITNILHDKNKELYTARSGKQALKIASVRDIDLILLDISMPEMDGYEVCKRLKADEKTASIPVIFLTAKVQPEDVVKGFNVGAVDYITKPFNFSELMVRVHNHLDRKRSRDIINEQYSKLQELNSIKDKFFLLITSDLRAPFNELKELTNDLVFNFDKLELPELKNYAKDIQKSAGKGYSLLEKLVEWSRIQRNEVRYSPQTINVSEIIDQKIEEFKEDAKKKNIKLFYETNDDFYILADRSMINFILSNLISNALKYSNSGGDIIISSKNDEDFVEITVYDTGIGIAKENISKIFETGLFFSTKGTNGETGTGIGLIICKDFVERHKGKLWVESMEGIGSDFKFTIPKGDPFAE